ncbi:MAG: DUF1508 domain-containing protein [Clostridiales bacterium]|nr:DUF1508 domain-containing protein [Clostridiales bacterium]
MNGILLNIQSNFFIALGNLFGLKDSTLGGVVILITILLIITAGILIAIFAVKYKKEKAKNQAILQSQKLNTQENKKEKVQILPVDRETAKQENKVEKEQKVEQKLEQKKEPILNEEQENAEIKVAESPKKEAKTKNGRWVIEKKGEGEYISTLLASNGELMLTSETYASEEGARNGVATIINAVDSGKFIVYKDKNNNYYCKLKTASNRLLCVSEIYDNEGRCLMAIESIKRFAKESPIQEQVNAGVKYVDYTPAPLNLADIKKGTEGKWKIEKEGDKYWAKLYASNGQVMLATEQVVNVKNARNAIDAVKKNALEGNFIIDHDKSGRFYYKLRNSQRSVICIGEAYDKLESCIKAIESVRRFANTAIILEEQA